MKLTPKSVLFLAGGLLVVYILFLFFLVKQAIEPPSPESESPLGLLFPAVYYSALITPVIVGLLAARATYKKKVKEREAIERVGSYIEGAGEEKILHRELMAWEKFLLEQKYSQTGDRNYDLDRRSPVFHIQGWVVKLEPTGNQLIKLGEEWSVRGFKLNEGNFPDIRWRTFSEGEEIAVEFSPFSKWVWDAYKIVKGKRNWLMHTTNENFEPLSSGTIKVVPRAPYGTHRLEEIERGDLITFYNVGTAKQVNVEVEYVKHYKTAEGFLKTEGVENVFPQAASFEEAVKRLSSMEDYEKRIQKGGIYAIRIRLLNS